MNHNKFIYIIILILAILVSLLGGTILGKGDFKINNEENKVENSTSEDDEVVLEYEILDINEYEKKLLVNGKETKVTGLYISDISKLKDALIVASGGIDVPVYYVVNAEGEIINSFVGNSYVNPETPYIVLNGGIIRGKYKITGDDIYIESDNLGQDPVYTVCNAKFEDKVVKYTEKFTYLGDGVFSASTITDSITVKQYIENNDIVCVKY